MLTHRIQLLVNSDDAVYKKEVLDTLYRWQNMSFRSANYIFTHHFIQDQISELFFINEGLRLKLSNMHKDTDGVLTTSRLNTTYQLLSKHFKGKLPSDIFSGLNNMLVKQYNNERVAYWKGEKVLPNYKRNIPMPIKGRSIKNLRLMENGKNFTFTLFSLPFRTYLGNGKNNKKALLQRIVAGSLQLHDSYIQLKKGKIFLLAVVAYEREKHALQQNNIAEVSLSVEYPITVTIGKAKYTIGTKEEFLYRRLAIQAACRRAQQAVNYSHSGRGRNRKFKGVHKYRDIEKNYVNTRLHLYSRRLIDICVKHRAGTLLLTDQQEKEAAAQEEAFLLRNWSYGNLKQKIEYKAAKAGIMVITE